MFKIFVYKLKKELEEVKSLHRIEMQEKNAAFELLKKQSTQEIEMKTREVTALLKLQSEQKIAQIELDSKKASAEIALTYEKKANDLEKKSNDKLLALQSKLMQDFQDKFTSAISKLHEEGNVTTKFVQDLALNMLGKNPATKTEVKMITKHESEEKE